MLSAVIWVALGGAFGAVARFIMSAYINSILKSGSSIISVLSVNIIGSFVMGFAALWIMGIAENKTAHLGLDAQTWKWFILIGFLGSFTTVSSFSLESMMLLQSQQYVKAIINMLMTATFTVVSCGLGMLLYQKISS